MGEFQKKNIKKGKGVTIVEKNVDDILDELENKNKMKQVRNVDDILEEI